VLSAVRAAQVAVVTVAVAVGVVRVVTDVAVVVDAAAATVDVVVVAPHHAATLVWAVLAVTAAVTVAAHVADDRVVVVAVVALPRRHVVPMAAAPIWVAIQPATESHSALYMSPTSNLQQIWPVSGGQHGHRACARDRVRVGCVQGIGRVAEMPCLSW
jgi:hypothetical protein